MSTFDLTIKTPEGDLYQCQAKSLSFTSEEGHTEVQAHHATLTTTFKFSPIRVEEEGKVENFVARNGMVLFNNTENSAVVTALYCQKRSEISHKTVEEYLAYLDQQLENKENLSNIQILFLEGEKLAVEIQSKETEA